MLYALLRWRRAGAVPSPRSLSDTLPSRTLSWQDSLCLPALHSQLWTLHRWQHMCQMSWKLQTPEWALPNSVLSHRWMWSKGYEQAVMLEEDVQIHPESLCFRAGTGPRYRGVYRLWKRLQDVFNWWVTRAMFHQSPLCGDNGAECSLVFPETNHLLSFVHRGPWDLQQLRWRLLPVSFSFFYDLLLIIIGPFTAIKCIVRYLIFQHQIININLIVLVGLLKRYFQKLLL